MYRLWERGVDMGIAHERAARLWLQAALAHYHPLNGELPRIEPVEPDAPVFLP
jgi:hypothetical protein